MNPITVEKTILSKSGKFNQLPTQMLFLRLSDELSPSVSREILNSDLDRIGSGSNTDSEFNTSRSTTTTEFSSDTERSILSDSVMSDSVKEDIFGSYGNTTRRNLFRQEITHKNRRDLSRIKEQTEGTKSMTEDDSGKLRTRESKMKNHKARFSRSLQALPLLYRQKTDSKKISYSVRTIQEQSYICEDHQVFLWDKKISILIDARETRTLRQVLEKIMVKETGLSFNSHYPSDLKGNELDLELPSSLIPLQLFFLRKDQTETHKHIVTEDRIISHSDIFRDRSEKEIEKLNSEFSGKFKIPKFRGSSNTSTQSKEDSVLEDELKNIVIKSQGLKIENHNIKCGTMRDFILLLTHPISRDLEFTNLFLMGLEIMIKPFNFCELLFERWEEVKGKSDSKVVRERIMELFIVMFEIRRDIFEIKNLPSKLFYWNNTIKNKISRYNEEISSKFSDVIRKLTNVQPQPVKSLSIPSVPLILNNYDILEFSAKDIAKQLTLIDSENFIKIKPTEWTEKNGTFMQKYTKRYNMVSLWVTSLILLAPTRLKIIMFKKFLKIITECFALHNYTAVMALVNGLCHSSCMKLYKCLHISESELDRLKQVECPSGMFKFIRNLQQSVHVPCVPFLTCYLMQIEVWNETGKDKCIDKLNENLINFDCIQQISLLIQIIEKFRSNCSYNNLEEDKKLRHYLENLVVLSDSELEEYSKSQMIHHKKIKNNNN